MVVGFDCDNNQLTSLEGCPQEVGGGFDCRNNQLTSLKGCPQKVGGWFWCDNNQLTSLEGCPKEVGGRFSCNNNQLTSLEGCPQKVGGWFYCRNNQLTSLKGCPQKVGGDFDCDNNQLTSLEGCPKEVGGWFSCNNNQLTSLEGCPQKVGGWFYCSDNSITIIPDDFKFTDRLFGDIYLYKDEVWSFFDGVKKNVLKQRKQKNIDIYYFEDGVCIKKDGIYSHGKTLKEAKEDWIYKISNSDTTEYKDMNIDTIISFEEMIKMYRTITGACGFGCRDFIKTNNVEKRKYSIKEIIDLTQNQYGSNTFKEFFKK